MKFQHNANMKLRTIVVKVVGSGTENDPYKVNLPSYTIIKELTPRDEHGKFHPNPKVMISVPDDEWDEKTGRLDKKKIRQKYKDNEKWDRPDVGDDI